MLTLFQRIVTFSFLYVDAEERGPLSFTWTIVPKEPISDLEAGNTTGEKEISNSWWEISAGDASVLGSEGK